jgi:signal transduction histidine kinase
MSQELTGEDTRKAALVRLRRSRRWSLWLVPKPIDLVTSLLYLSIPILFFYFNSVVVECSCTLLQHGEAHAAAPTCPCPFPWLKEALIIAMMLALLAIDRLEYWFYGEATPARVAVILFITRLACIEIAAQLDSFRFSPFLYLVVPFLARLYFGDLISICLTGLAWIIYPIKHALQSPHWYTQATEIQYFFVYTLGLAFALTMTRVVVRERASRARAEQLLSELEASHQQLKSYAEQVEELAAAKERNRLARDIHDSLGHYLTVINVQLEKALAFSRTRPGEADQAIANAKGLASEALQDVRRSVKALRTTSDGFSAHRALGTLIEHIQGSQLAIELRVEGSETGFSQDALLALYRAAQEGLTNVQKHAGATRVRIELHFGALEASLRLSDNGRGFDPSLLRRLPPGRESGYGLQGVEERLELIGGSFALETAPGAGTCLTIGVPKTSAVHHRDPQEHLLRKGETA